ncbi:MAG: hypothetical protein OEX12_13690, partial [Gammaproteobacteria bacterium]|nr:hypothetical protein [Gammaproteobacteria bacterium]
MRRTKLSTFAVLVAGVSLAACGGGTPPGSAPASTNVTLAGVVAAGAPLIGYVSIKDSAGASVVGYLDENGGYSADISELSAPYLLYASGTVGTKVYTLLSAATEADHDKTVNITPLTDLIVANVVGQSAVEFYNTPDFSKITTAALEAQEDVLEARLRPLLDAAGVAADFDLRNSAFTPDHTGIDAVLDVITVEVDATTDIATITNILDSTQTITDDLADSSDNTELGAGTVTLTTLGEIQTLTDGMEGVAVLHASNVTDPAQFAPALADGLSFDGASKDDLLELFINPDPTARQMVTNYMEGTKVFSLKSMDLAATTPVAWVTFGGESSAVKFTKTGANGEWQFAGNDRGVNVSLMAETFKSGSGVHYVLTPDVGDFSAEITGTARNMLPGDYFVVTGPGLPTAGLVLIQSAFNDTNNASTPGMAGEGWGYGRTEAQLLAGGVVDGSVYTFVWYRDVGLDTTFRVDGTILSTDIATGIAADTVVDSYTTTLAKRPPASTETAYFPAITVPTSSDTATFA